MSTSEDSDAKVSWEDGSLVVLAMTPMLASKVSLSHVPLPVMSTSEEKSSGRTKGMLERTSRDTLRNAASNSVRLIAAASSWSRNPSQSVEKERKKKKEKKRHDKSCEISGSQGHSSLHQTKASDEQQGMIRLPQAIVFQHALDCLDCIAPVIIHARLQHSQSRLICIFQRL